MASTVTSFLLFRLTPVIFFTSTCLSSPAQDSTWKKLNIDENLSVLFPAVTYEVDTTVRKEGKLYRFRMLRSETGTSVLGIIVTPNETKINADNPESLEQALKGLTKGTMNSLARQGFDCTVYDTTVASMPCKKISCTNDSDLPFINYVFLVNDKMYAIQGAALDNATSKLASDELEALMRSVRFTAKNIKERQFSSKAESTGYKIGKLLFPLLIIAAIIAFVFRKK